MCGASHPHHYLCLLGFPPLHLGSCYCIPEQGKSRVGGTAVIGFSVCLSCLDVDSSEGTIQLISVFQVHMGHLRMLAGEFSERAKETPFIVTPGFWSKCLMFVCEEMGKSSQHLGFPAFCGSGGGRLPSSFLFSPPLTHRLIDVWKQ